MKYQRCLEALVAATFLLVSLGASQAHAQRVIAIPGHTYPSGPFLGGGLTTPQATWTLGFNPYAVYTPYTAPYPAYDILPLPFASARIYTSWASDVSSGGRFGDPLGYVPRKRTSLYPAVPAEKAPENRQADLRRVRFEITVPFAHAELYLDGARTRQTGLHRVFVTPPMDEDRHYSSTIRVQWTKQSGVMSEPREKTFTFVAGETVRYQFKE